MRAGPGRRLCLRNGLKIRNWTRTRADPLAAAASPTGLVLTSTLIGVERRGAYINNRLYLEGAAIEHEGEWFRLSAVYPQSVLLEKDGELLELTVQKSPAHSKRAKLAFCVFARLAQWAMPNEASYFPNSVTTSVALPLAASCTRIAIRGASSLEFSASRNGVSMSGFLSAL